MRNPNGYGSVVKLSGNRRNPFAVRKTKGFNEKGHPIYISVGYASTREQGMIMLAEYNKSPWDIDSSKITFEKLYKLFDEKRMDKLGSSKQASLKTCFKHSSKYHKMKYKEIKAYHMQDIVDNCGKGYSTQGAIRNLFVTLDKFALEMDIIDKSYSSLVVAPPKEDSTKTPFTNDEVAKVWKHKDLPWADTVLFYLYSGFRLTALLKMKISDINLEERTFKGGVKTDSGKDRIVPIHSKIFDMVEKRVNEGHEYLFTFKGKKVTPGKYYLVWVELMKTLEMNHTTHECRHTFRSGLDSAGANKVSIDLLMGHKSSDIGERVYTHKTLQELKDTIELISY